MFTQTKNMTSKQQLTDYLQKEGKNESWAELAEKFGLDSAEVARHTWRAFRRESGESIYTVMQDAADEISELSQTVTKLGIKYEEDVKGDKAQITISVDQEIKTLDELIEKTNIDVTKWQITRWIQNFWNNKYKVKAWLEPVCKNTDEDFKNGMTKFLDEYKSEWKAPKAEEVLQNDKFNRPSMLLISLADFHLDKRTLDGKTIDQKVELYKTVITNILAKSFASYNIEEIVYVTSNDLLHTDNYQESTARLTPQQSSVSWHEAYERAFGLQLEAIRIMRTFCKKLYIIHVPSNHSRTKEYYLTHAMAAFYKSDADIIFDRSAEPTKCHVYGNTFLGFNHGDVRDYNQIPTYFASKYKEQWGKTKYAEIALADKHHRKEWKHGLTANEVHGTRMFICPSLSGEDTWHKDSLYDLSIKASIGRIYDKETGYSAEFEERV